MYCPHCGTALPKEAMFCHSCGKQVSGAGSGATDMDQELTHTPSAKPYDPYISQSAAYYGSQTTRAVDTQNVQPGQVVPPSKAPHVSSGFLKGVLIGILVIILLIGGFAGLLILRHGEQSRMYSGSTTPQTTPQPSPTPTPESVLYQANWSGGLNGWSGSKDWNVQGGMLVSDGSNRPSGAAGPTILAPYQLASLDNFAIEIKVEQTQTVGGFDPLLFHGKSLADGSWQGYKLTICNCGDVRITSDDFNNVLARAPFDPGTSWHTYRVEIRGPNMMLSVDGQTRFIAHDSRFVSGEQVGIKTSKQITVSNFKIVKI